MKPQNLYLTLDLKEILKGLGITRQSFYYVKDTLEGFSHAGRGKYSIRQKRWDFLKSFYAEKNQRKKCGTGTKTI